MLSLTIFNNLIKISIRRGELMLQEWGPQIALLQSPGGYVIAAAGWVHRLWPITVEASMKRNVHRSPFACWRALGTGASGDSRAKVPSVPPLMTTPAPSYECVTAQTSGRRQRLNAWHIVVPSSRDNSINPLE
jgi:hypothetical protein